MGWQFYVEITLKETDIQFNTNLRQAEESLSPGPARHRQRQFHVSPSNFAAASIVCILHITRFIFLHLIWSFLFFRNFWLKFLLNQPYQFLSYLLHDIELYFFIYVHFLFIYRICCNFIARYHNTASLLVQSRFSDIFCCAFLFTTI